MKHKNILLVMFFLTLFVFQQVQAGESMPLAEKSSGVNVPLASDLFSIVRIRIFPIDASGNKTSTTLCYWGMPQNGCPEQPKLTGVLNGVTYDCNQETTARAVSENDPTTGYPLYFYLCPERDYLPDVVAQEMGLDIIRPPETEALRAQAVAARTVASWKAENISSIIDNTNAFQVYIPGKKDATYEGTSYGEQIKTAVLDTAGEFLYYDWNGQHEIDAEFAADALENTITEPVSDPKPYLTGVSDPISSTMNSNASVLPDACKANPNLGQLPDGSLNGMSQRGAIRWASGNQCLPLFSGSASVPWPKDMPSPIKWDYRQILAHYYTGVEFKNDNTGAYFAPNDRWNLLNYTIPLVILSEAKNHRRLFAWLRVTIFTPITLTDERINPNPKRSKT